MNVFPNHLFRRLLLATLIGQSFSTFAFDSGSTGTEPFLEHPINPLLCLSSKP